MENKEILEELYLILKKDGIPSKEERKDFHFKVNQAKNIAIYNDDEYMVQHLTSIEDSMTEKVSALTYAYEKGYKLGFAKRLLDVLDTKTIAKVMGLTIEEVESLK